MSDATIPASANGRGSDARPSAPPSIIMPIDTPGQTSSARRPFSPAHRPTATMPST